MQFNMKVDNIFRMLKDLKLVKKKCLHKDMRQQAKRLDNIDNILFLVIFSWTCKPKSIIALNRFLRRAANLSLRI